MKRFLSALMMAALVAMLAGCGVMANNSAVRQTCTKLINAVIIGDVDSAYGCIAKDSGTISYDEFMEVYEFMSERIYGVQIYELNQTSMESNWENDVYVTDATYILKCGNKQYLIEVQDHSTYDGLEFFSFSDYKSGGLFDKIQGDK